MEDCFRNYQLNNRLKQVYDRGMVRASKAITGTRAALLHAAAEVFVQHGYHHARVRDIAKRARANLAAINYHFGSKQGLYLATLKSHATAMLERYPVAEPSVRDLPPEQRLRAAVHNLLARFLAAETDGLMPRLLVSELAHPTPALETMVEQFARPQLGQLFAIVARLLGPKATPEQVRSAAFSVGGQCMFYLFARPMVSRVAPDLYAPDALEKLSAHITTFSLDALTAMRRSLEEANA